MKRFLGITVFLALAICARSQSTGNPFDLAFRKPKPPATVVDTPVIHSQPIIPTPPPPTPSGPDTSRPSFEIQAPDTAKADPNNPFEKKITTATATPPTDIPPAVTATPPQEKVLIPPVLNQSSSKGFQIFFVLFSLLFLIFIVNVERNFVRDLWRVISNENYSSLHHRNQRNTMRQILLLMGYGVFVMQAGLFLFFTQRFFQYAGPLAGSVWACIGLVLGIYLARHAVIRYLRWLFNNEKEMTLFGFDISIFNTMVGLILLPINVLLIFGPESIYKPLIIIGVITLSLAYLMRQLRWILTARQLIVHSLFLFFVYLCAVEILPLWAISKLFW